MRRQEVAGLLLAESEHAPSQVIPAHEHAPAHFCLGLTGGCVERIRGRDVECVTGTAEFHPVGTKHSSRWGTHGGRCFTITLDDDWISRLALESTPPPHTGVLDATSRDLLTRLHRELVAFDPCSPLVIEGLALALLGTAGRSRRATPRGAPAWMPQVEEYLRAHFAQPFRVGAVAQVAGVAPVSLSKWYRRVHGCTIGERVRAMRVDHAARLLTTSRLSITQVALASGFVDHAHLTKTFKRLRQLTPSDYRARGSLLGPPDR